MAKRTVLIGLSVVGGVALIVCLLSWGGLQRDKSDDGGMRIKDAGAANANVQGRGGRMAVRSGGASAAVSKRSVREMPLDIFEHLTGKDKQYAEAIQAALDADDFKATLAAVNSALKSKNPEVRENAVDALSWFGVEALPELTGAMADPDEDVADAAENAWEMALQEIDEADRRFSIAASAMRTPFKKDHLMTIGSQMAGAAMEMIDNEEDEQKANEIRVMVVQTLVDIMDSGREENIEQAKEAYAEITGNEWRSIEEAERYLADPENYELPDEPDEVVMPIQEEPHQEPQNPKVEREEEESEPDGANSPEPPVSNGPAPNGSTPDEPEPEEPAPRKAVGDGGV